MKRFLDGVMTIVTMGALGLMPTGCGIMDPERGERARAERAANEQKNKQKTEEREKENKKAAIHLEETPEAVERERVEQKKRNINWEREQEYQEKKAVEMAALKDNEEWTLIEEKWENSELAALSAERDAAYAVHEMAEMNARVAKEDETRAALAAAAEALRIRETIAYCAAQPDVADHLREDICR